MHIESYLSRIGYKSQPVADFETLRKLHLSHLCAVPFENLDIHSGKRTVLSVDSLYAKIVSQRRGGICYELNGLFAWLLRSIGFDVTVLAANVYVGGMEWTPDFDHMALAVTINEKCYLVDVGFGDSFLVPLNFTNSDLQNDGRSNYKISLGGGFYVLSKAASTAPDLLLQPSFRVKLIPHSLEDFSDRYTFHQNSPDSHFRRKIVCSRAEVESRITLSGSELIVSTANDRKVTKLGSPEKVKAALYEHFGVVQ
jgi:N-hydroxyarylamine O-acetyltransferase